MATQVKNQPPTFTLFVNEPKLFGITYRRYIEKQIRVNLGFEGTPLILLWRGKQQRAKIKIKDEIIDSVNSLNRVISSNVYSSINYPTGDNAAFDGYAINSKDTNQIKKNSQKQFKIIGSIAAGSKPLKKKIKKFNAIEIMTGGIIPKGFDT